jgi:hypothetical protein
MQITRNEFDDRVQQILDVGENLDNWERNFIVRVADTEFYRVSVKQIETLNKIHGRYYPNELT